MAYPADTAVETAIGTIELVLNEDHTLAGNREAVGAWRELLRFIESVGATGYDALAQEDLFNA
jgi:hypothetical protein